MKLLAGMSLLTILALSLASFSPLFDQTAKAQSAASPNNIRPIGKPVEIKAPLGLPPVPIPADNPPTEDTIALGRRLYYDPLLSSDQTISCASCHAPQFAFSDNRPVSEGVGKKLGTRHAPTVINSAYSSLQFWDGRAASLEEQAVGPMANPVEMAHTLDGVVKRLQADPNYPAMFKKAWGTDQITIDMVAKSIASFERTVIAGNSGFDRFMYGHDSSAMSPEAQRGLRIFMSPKKGNCAVCHSIDRDYALLTDNKFHNLGVGADARGNLADVGRYAVTKKEEDMGAFKTPTLRNLTNRGPYMHDGSFHSTKDTLGHYIGGGNYNPHLDKEIHSLDSLTMDERDDLLQFLDALNGPLPPNIGPPPDLAIPAKTVSAGK
ncbi:MAG TPA: cytochrome c peroxidase [Candidatus Saccharimonadales bacterium]|nr:cytochrome c peroxidase [Candidatus Saccharimonadales bacterium]